MCIYANVFIMPVKYIHWFRLKNINVFGPQINTLETVSAHDGFLYDPQGEGPLSTCSGSHTVVQTKGIEFQVCGYVFMHFNENAQSFGESLGAGLPVP